MSSSPEAAHQLVERLKVMLEVGAAVLNSLLDTWVEDGHRALRGMKP